MADVEKPPAEETDPTYWGGVYNEWRIGNQLWLLTNGSDSSSGGYIIDYSSTPRVVSRWLSRYLCNDVIRPLPDGVHLLYTTLEDTLPSQRVKEFTVAQVEAMDLHFLNYRYAAEKFERNCELASGPFGEIFPWASGISCSTT